MAVDRRSLTIHDRLNACSCLNDSIQHAAQAQTLTGAISSVNQVAYVHCAEYACLECNADADDNKMLWSICNAA